MTLSLEHIRSQISTGNVLEELFSDFTSRCVVLLRFTIKPTRSERGYRSYPAVREMELTFAQSHWDALKASSALKAKVREVAQGERPYAEEVLFELLSGRR